MKLREKLKRAEKEIAKLEKELEGKKRGERYLFALCERTKQEAATEKEIMGLFLAGCVLAGGGEMTIQTDNLKRAMEGKEIKYEIEPEKHKATVRIAEK